MHTSTTRHDYQLPLPPGIKFIILIYSPNSDKKQNNRFLFFSSTFTHHYGNDAPKDKVHQYILNIYTYICIHLLMLVKHRAHKIAFIKLCTCIVFYFVCSKAGHANAFYVSFVNQSLKTAHTDAGCVKR